MFPSLKNSSSEFSFPFKTGRSEDCSKNRLDFFSKNPYFPYFQDLRRLIPNPKLLFKPDQKRPQSLNENVKNDFYSGLHINKMAFFEKQLKGAYDGLKEIKEKDHFLQKEGRKRGIKQKDSSKNKLNRSTVMENERKNQFESKLSINDKFIIDNIKENNHQNYDLPELLYQNNKKIYEIIKENQRKQENQNLNEFSEKNEKKITDGRLLAAKTKFFSLEEKNEKFKRNNSNPKDFHNEMSQFQSLQQFTLKIPQKNSIILPKIFKNNSYRGEIMKKNEAEYENVSKDNSKIGFFLINKYKNDFLR